MPDNIKLPSGATLIDPESASLPGSVSATSSVQLPPGAKLLDATSIPTAPTEKHGLFDTSWLLPKLDIGGIAKGVADFPREAARQAEAHKGQTLAQRARDPSDLQTAEQLAAIAGPANLEGSAIQQTAARPAAVAARQAGYVLPPRAISEKPGIVSQALAGYGGKVKTAQDASLHNAEVSTNLATQSLGLPKDTVLNDQTFNNVRAQAGQAYQAVAKAIPVVGADAAYDTSIAGLAGANSHAAQLFPKIMKNHQVDDLIAELQGVRAMPTEDALEVVKRLRYDANANLHAAGEPSKHALGLAQRQAADAIDDLVDRNIQQAGGGPLVDAYRRARQMIARSYDVEAVTNPATGEVNSLGLAKLAAKGRPLGGELDTIAKTAAAFPKAMQAGEYGEKVGVVDFFGATGMALAGHPEGVGFFLGRPLARMGALSKPVQNLSARSRPGVPSPPPNAAARATAAFTSENPALPQSVTDPYAAQIGQP